MPAGSRRSQYNLRMRNGLAILALLLCVVGTAVWTIGASDAPAAVLVQSDAAAADKAPTSVAPAPNAEVEITASVPRWRFRHYYELPEVPEPSGLCWCGSRGTMFTVDDGGGPERPSALSEVSLDGQVLARLEFGRDIEGVTWSAHDERLYVVDEADERVFVVDAALPQLALLGSFSVSRRFQGEEVLTAGGNGFEGVAWIPSGTDAAGTLLILNQDDPTALLAVDLRDVRLDAEVEAAGFWLLPQRNSGALHYDAPTGELWVVNSWLNTLLVLRVGELRAGEAVEVLRWEVVPGLAQEGVALDPEGRLWVAQDTGGIAVYTRDEAR